MASRSTVVASRFGRSRVAPGRSRIALCRNCVAPTLRKSKLGVALRQAKRPLPSFYPLSTVPTLWISWAPRRKPTTGADTQDNGCATRWASPTPQGGFQQPFISEEGRDGLNAGRLLAPVFLEKERRRGSRAKRGGAATAPLQLVHTDTAKRRIVGKVSPF